MILFCAIYREYNKWTNHFACRFLTLRDILEYICCSILQTGMCSWGKENEHCTFKWDIFVAKVKLEGVTCHCQPVWNGSPNLVWLEAFISVRWLLKEWRVWEVMCFFGQGELTLWRWTVLTHCPSLWFFLRLPCEIPLIEICLSALDIWLCLQQSVNYSSATSFNGIVSVAAYLMICWCLFLPSRACVSLASKNRLIGNAAKSQVRSFMAVSVIKATLHTEMMT